MRSAALPPASSSSLGASVSHIHLRHLWPLPHNLGELLSRFETVIVAEMNTGQLLTVLRDTLLVDAKGLNMVSGRPFRIADLLQEILTEAGHGVEARP